MEMTGSKKSQAGIEIGCKFVNQQIDFFFPFTMTSGFLFSFKPQNLF